MSASRLIFPPPLSPPVGVPTCTPCPSDIRVASTQATMVLKSNSPSALAVVGSTIWLVIFAYQIVFAALSRPRNRSWPRLSEVAVAIDDPFRVVVPGADIGLDLTHPVIHL